MSARSRHSLGPCPIYVLLTVHEEDNPESFVGFLDLFDSVKPVRTVTAEARLPRSGERFTGTLPDNPPTLLYPERLRFEANLSVVLGRSGIR
jgi:hypothetical protein